MSNSDLIATGLHLLIKVMLSKEPVERLMQEKVADGSHGMTD